MSNASEFDHGTEHRANKRHAMEKFTNRSGVNIRCKHCDVSIKHPTKTNKLGPIDSWHYTDKTGMKEAWEAHKADNQ